MKKKTQISDEHITKDGDSVDRDKQYISPDVYLAQSGETVVFTMDVNAAEEKDSDSNS